MLSRIAIVLGALLFIAPANAAPKKIVFIAGKKSHGPGHHEYERGLRLLKYCLDHGPLADQVVTELHLDGWPQDEKTLDDADTIVLFCDGSDRDEKAHPLLNGDRMKKLGQQMQRGCGFVALHYTVFVPVERGGREFLDWLGGYFDYETGPAPRKWYSKIQTAQTRATPATPDHPINRGMVPFDLREEYYYNLRFRPGDGRIKPILTTAIPNEMGQQLVAWSVERDNGGRGFGFTGGHFHDNWRNEHFRRMVLNAIVWTAKVEVPANGVSSALPADALLDRVAVGRPIRTLLVTGHQYPGHKWQQTTPALADAFARDPRIDLRISEDPEEMAKLDLSRYGLIVMNYCNWQRPGLSDAAKKAFVDYLRGGGGLIIVHFANGAWHFSLPDAKESDWPEWRTKICRRVWDHTPGQSGHDAYGKFRVEIAKEHPITQGLKAFETTDELYYRQIGDEPIEVLAAAKSKVTGNMEPMAFIYEYGKGRVFQTVLGHDAPSLRTPEVAEMLRKAVAWVAQREQVAAVNPPMPIAAPQESLTAGKFGKALDARISSVEVGHKAEYQTPPLTVECWTKLFQRDAFNILVAKNRKSSADHWEIYSYAGSGEFSAYLPGYAPAEIKSGVNIVDQQWHHVAMTFDGKTVILFVDGKMVKSVPVRKVGMQPGNDALWIGAYPEHAIGCNGLIDEVRISNALREIKGVPDRPLEVDDNTLSLWRLDDFDNKRLADAGKLQNAGVVRGGGQVATPNAPLEVAYRMADPKLKIVKIDHSADESFLSLRVDLEGRIFVGCREAVFAYDPDEKGGYHPRRLLYRFPADSWVNDVEIRGDDVYAMTTAALYVLPGARTKREAITPKRLVWGTPVDLHVTYHGMSWGPDGDLYFTSGDPLLTYGDFANRPDHWGHWNIYCQPDGSKLPYTGVGGFYRVRPDGSKLQVIAQGTRGSFGLCHDADWNLFSNDNDHESIPARYVPGRLLHVAPRAHFFWPRGWMAHLTPDRADVLDTMFDGMGRAVPVGQCFYGDSYLPAMKGKILVAQWGARRIDSYSIVRQGASYRSAETPLLIGDGAARPVGVAVGRGGRIFATISHLAGNAYSPKYPSDLVMITRADDPATHPFESRDLTKASVEKLLEWAIHPDWSVRSAAHQEVLRRGADVRESLSTALIFNRDSAMNPVLIWLAAAQRDAELNKLLLKMMDNPARDGWLQPFRALAEFSPDALTPALVDQALQHADLRVQHAAVHHCLRLAKLPTALFAGPARNRDTYLRQLSAFVIAERGTLTDIESLMNATDAPGRLAGILAAGFRLTVPPTDEVPPEALPLTVRKSGSIWDAYTTLQYADAKIDLFKLGRMGSYTTAERWAKLPHTAEQEQLFTLLHRALQDADALNRGQAAYFLSLLNDARSEPTIAKVRRDSSNAQLASAPVQSISECWLSKGYADDGNTLSLAHTPETGPVDLASTHVGWTRTKTPLALRATMPTSFYAYVRVQADAPGRAELFDLPSVPMKLWHNGRELAVGSTVRLDLEPGSNDLLLRYQVRDALTVAPKVRAIGKVVVVVPEPLVGVSLAERLKSGKNEVTNLDAFLKVNFSTAAETGDIERGRKLFSADGLGCVKCHAILPGQPGAGAPSLAEARKRFTVPHLVESILLPNKEVAPAFRTTTVQTVQGVTHSGLLVEESDEALTLLLPDTRRITVRRKDVEERSQSPQSPMPANLVRTPDELRDLLAYLLSGNP